MALLVLLLPLGSPEPAIEGAAAVAAERAASGGSRSGAATTPAAVSAASLTVDGGSRWAQWRGGESGLKWDSVAGWSQ